MNYNRLIIKQTFALHAISGNKILCDHHFPPETSTANQLLFIKKIKLIIGITGYVLMDIQIMYPLTANFEL